MARTSSVEKKIQIALARKHRVKRMQIVSVRMHILLARTQMVNNLNESFPVCQLNLVTDLPGEVATS